MSGCMLWGALVFPHSPPGLMNATNWTWGGCHLPSSSPSVHSIQGNAGQPPISLSNPKSWGATKPLSPEHTQFNPCPLEATALQVPGQGLGDVLLPPVG